MVIGYLIKKFHHNLHTVFEGTTLCYFIDYMFLRKIAKYTYVLL